MTKAIFWFRRDIRVDDNHALSVASLEHKEVYPVFIFDENILKKLKEKEDKRVNFIFKQLEILKKIIPIAVYYGDPVDIIPEISKKMDNAPVYANEDYESYAIKRDQAISKKLDLHLYKDTVIQRFDEVKNKQEKPYKVFTPYKRRWLEILDNKTADLILKYPVKKEKIKELKIKKKQVSSLRQINFKSIDLEDYVELDPEKTLKSFWKKIDDYNDKRDFPAIEGTSRLSVHLRFGTISIRELVRKVYPTDSEGKKIWLSELIWRDFYFAVLGNFPHVETKSFIAEFENIKWDNDKKIFEAWCEGNTGVPIVDAGMRQLNQTGWMHNRLRMITASYLCKTLLINWKWGEKYFKEKLIDFDLAANNGGWQWSSSTGCDAAPYFRIFNPYTQSKKFDKSGDYIRKYVPELKEVPEKFIHEPFNMKPLEEEEYNLKIGKDYPSPVVDYKANRSKALSMYKKAKELK